MTQQKQRKQLILTDNKNISSDRFEPAQQWHKKFHVYQAQRKIQNIIFHTVVTTYTTQFYNS